MDRTDLSAPDDDSSYDGPDADIASGNITDADFIHEGDDDPQQAGGTTKDLGTDAQPS